MNKNPDCPIGIFQKESPEVSKAFGNLIQSIKQLKGMDEKTKHLIYIAIKASQGELLAVKFHVSMAKKLGATRDEIKCSILITLTTSGIKGVVFCLPEAMKIYDKEI